MNSILETIFQQSWNNLRHYQSLLRERPVILAYSGGKDSSLLLQFYLWLKENELILHSPSVYHLDHSIRKNSAQESELFKYAKSLNLQCYFKKKTFLYFPKGPALVSKKPVGSFDIGI